MVGEAKALLHRNARRVRILAWGALVPVAVLNVLAWRDATQLGDVARVLIFLVPPACAFVGSLLAFSVSTPQTSERTFWAVSSVATGFLLAGKAYFGIYQLTVDVRGPSVPSAFDFLNFCAAASFVVLLALMLRRRSRGLLSDVGGIVSTVALTAILYAVTYRWVAAPLVQASGRSPTLGAIWAVYILIGAALLLGSLGSVLGHRAVRASGWQLLTAIALAFFGLVVMFWPVWDPTQRVQAISSPELWLNLGYVFGYYLFFMGAVYWMTAPLPARAALLSGAIRPTARMNLAVTSVSLLALPLLAWWAYTAAPRSVDRAVYFAAAAVVTGAAVLRTALADVESVSLRKDETRDLLTGVLNRRGFDARFEELVEQSAARGASLSLVVLDMDDFARFNVMSGRAAGDAALCSLAGVLSAKLTPGEGAIGRLGGDEFVVVLPDTDKTAALFWASGVSGADLSVPEATGPALSVSGGVATRPVDGLEPSVLLEHADAALYWAKYRGKHQVAGFDEAVGKVLEAEERIRRLAQESRLDIVRALAAATDARDAATAYHSRQVAALAALVCERLGLEDDRLRDVQTAALLHDIGKVAVPDSVLRKRARLSPGERAVLREHADLGARILEATELRYMAPWVRAHHERWDGAGYPDGIAGEDIPLEARIVAACNLYDQIVSGSPERGPLSRSAALQEIDQGMGGAVDPRVAEALIEVVAESRSLGWSEAWLS